MKPFLVINPSSAAGATGRHFDDISQAVRREVGDHGHAFTERPMHAAEITRKALFDGHDLIVAVGGDGTINEVVNGFFAPAVPGEEPRALGSSAALGLLPRGTGGDLRRSVGLNGNLLACAARLKGERRPIDVGRVDFIGHDGKPASRLFLNVGEAGVGARVVDLANKSSKLLGGKITFMLASLRALTGWRDLAVRASFDGGPAEELDVTTLAVANGRYFGGGMMVAPEASLEDGLFHVTIWRGFTLTDFVLKSGSMYDGTHVKLAGTRTLTARTIQLEPGRSATEPALPVLIEVDGEQIGRLPATFSLLPGALQIVS